MLAEISFVEQPALAEEQLRIISNLPAALEKGSLERALFQGCGEIADNPQLLLGQGRLLDEGYFGQHLHELHRPAGGPFPFFRSLEGSDRRGQMWSGLV